MQSDDELSVASLRLAATEIAQGAAALIKEHYYAAEEELQIDHKDTIDLVTSADHAAEQHILQEIRRRFPSHQILAEETGTTAPAQDSSPSDYRWIVDPLDGTVNFAHKIPHFAVLIAVDCMVDSDQRQSLVGVTLDPLRDELFVAEINRGASLNGRPIHVSTTDQLINGLLATGFAYDRLTRSDDNHAEYVRLNLLTRGVRRFGSAGLDLAYVACGRYDGYWEAALKPWDMTAGRLLVSEAGGRVTDFQGTQLAPASGRIVVSNGRIHAQLIQALQSATRYPINSRDGLAELLPAELADQLKRR